MEEYIQAVAKHDLDRVAELLSDDDFVFRLHGQDDKDKAEYLAALRGLSPIILRSDIQQILGGADEVAVVYDFVTDTPVGAVPTVEVVRVKDGTIRFVHLVFEQARWPEVIAELQRKTAS